MRITLPLIGVCLLSVLTGCHKPQTSDLIGAGETAIKATALTSITAKYPNMGSSDLKFLELNISPMFNGDGDEAIVVTYAIPASATIITNGMKVITNTKTIMVMMSPSGKVKIVSESMRGQEQNIVQ